MFDEAAGVQYARRFPEPAWSPVGGLLLPARRSVRSRAARIRRRAEADSPQRPRWGRKQKKWATAYRLVAAGSAAATEVRRSPALPPKCACAHRPWRLRSRIAPGPRTRAIYRPSRFLPVTSRIPPEVQAAAPPSPVVDAAIRVQSQHLRTDRVDPEQGFALPASRAAGRRPTPKRRTCRAVPAIQQGSSRAVASRTS